MLGPGGPHPPHTVLFPGPPAPRAGSDLRPAGCFPDEAPRAGGGALPDLAGQRPGGHPGPDPERPGPRPWGEAGQSGTGERPPLQPARPTATLPPSRTLGAARARPAPRCLRSAPCRARAHEDPRLLTGVAPASRASPARAPSGPEDVQSLGLAGGPGGRTGRARGLLASLWHRLPLGAGPPGPAPRTPRVSRDPCLLPRPAGFLRPPLSRGFTPKSRSSSAWPPWVPGS